MSNPVKSIVVSIGAVLHLACAFAQMPTAEALAAETKKQLGIANDAINKAANQASFPAPTVPLLVPAPAYLKPIDPAEIAKRYKDFSKPAAPELYVMVSFSMPDASLDRLAELSARAGATLVLMGLHKDSLPQTIERLSMFTKKYASLKVTIDPPLFLKFSVKAVPTFVLAKAPEAGTNAIPIGQVLTWYFKGFAVTDKP